MIKSKLIYSFVFFIAIIFFIGIVTVGSSAIQRYYSNQIIKSLNISNSIKAIYEEFKNIRKSVERYVLLGDEAELNNYRSSYENILNQVNIWRQYEKEEADSFFNKFDILNKIYKKMLTVSKKGDKGEIVKIVETEFIPSKGKLDSLLIEKVRSAENNILVANSRSKLISMNTTAISVFAVIIAIIIGTIVSIRIYRSIVYPLKILCSEAEKIGKGDLRSHIQLKSENEFNELATAFNKMIGDIRKLEAEIVQVDRLSSVGQLAGSVAHEINNPLSGVLGQAQIILERLQPDDPLYQNVVKIERAAKRCKESINRLLQFSRQRQYEFKETHLHELIEDTLALADADLKSKNIQVERRFFASLPPVLASAPHLQQVFLNIINNAIQAMSSGGSITIMTEYHKAQDINESFIDVCFIDTGYGIEQENIKKIFEPLFSTKPKETSAGMGLTISFEIIKRHNGEIIVESKGIGKGSTFKVRLFLGKKPGKY